ncbi:MAG: hypothetical protein CFE24_11280 [Flavobacterium sp. BFFFF2]|nr:MAG: hypothetical protein CFE24_11280 [Flavobacterium sp. BFFFF2]
MILETSSLLAQRKRTCRGDPCGRPQSGSQTSFLSAVARTTGPLFYYCFSKDGLFSARPISVERPLFVFFTGPNSEK